MKIETSHNKTEQSISDVSFSKPLETKTEGLQNQIDQISSNIWAPALSDDWPAIISLFSATFGIGSLGLVASMATIGPLGWLLTFGVSLFISFKANEGLVCLAHEFKISNYIELTPILESRLSKFLFFALFFATNIGALLTASVVYNELACDIVKAFGVTAKFLVDQKSLFWLFVPTLILFPLLIKRKFKDVAFFTLIALISAAYLTLLMAWSLAWSLFDRQTSGADNSIALFDWRSVPRVFGYQMFLLMFQPLTMLIYKEVSPKSVKNMKKLMRLNYLVLSAIYISIALCGFFLFNGHPRVSEEIFLVLFNGRHKWLVLVANALMTLTAFNCLIFGFKPLKDALIHLIRRRSEQLEREDEPDLSALNIGLTAGIAAVSCVLAALLIANDVTFLQIVDVLSNIVLPLLFVMTPLVLYLRLNDAAAVRIALVLCFLIYVWRMLEYVLAVKKYFAG